MLELSEVLKSTGNEVLIKLFQDYNDHYLDVAHLDLNYVNQGQSVQCNLVARVTSTDGLPGRYKGTVPVTYKRANLTTLLGGYQEFPFTTGYPFTFATMAAYLKAQYGLVIETQDVLHPITNGAVETTTAFNADMTLAGVLELKIADKSPRFLPKSSNGGSLFVKIIDPNGGQLDYLGATRNIGNVTLMDA